MKLTKDETMEARELAIDQSYNGLTGEWLEWLKVSKIYERKVAYQDRQDIRHDILIELQGARARIEKPLVFYQSLRIASFVVGTYWRNKAKREVKVCLYNMVATAPHCDDCGRKTGAKTCVYRGYRPVLSLEADILDSQGFIRQLKDTVADDKAIDLDAWLDASIWLLGCPRRLIEVADKKRRGQNLTKTDRQYLWRWRKNSQKSLFSV